MDHMTFMTFFSLLATVGMVLVILWGMSTVDPQGPGSVQPSASGRFGERPCISHPPYELRTDMIQEFVPWDSMRAVHQEYAFQPSLEVAYRQALKELLAAQARLTTQGREASQQSLFDQRNTLPYLSLADEAHPFNPIKEEAPC